MSERAPLAPEQESKERSETLIEAHEQQEKLRENLERNAENAHEQDTDKAKEAVEKAFAKKREKESSHTNEKLEKSRTPKRTKKTLDASFKREMSSARSHMSTPSRAFSKLIHIKPIEKASEAVGTTIARPNALLAGSVAAFLLTSGIYFWAKHIGYPLSGFETIGAFIIGWLIGITFDFTRIMITGKNT